MSAIDPEIKSVLDMRLAKGELNVTEYQSLIKTMTNDPEEKSVAPLKTGASTLSNPGSLRHVWRDNSDWKYRLHMRDLSNTDVKNHLLWLDSRTDFLVTDEYIIILSSPPETKVTQIAGNIAQFGAGSIGGGLLISLPAFLIGGAYEKLFGEKKNKFDEEALAAIFNSGYAIYSKKSKLKFQSFTIKAGTFDVAYPVVTITGEFENVFLGTVDLCFLYSSSSGRDFFKVDKTLREAGCLINTHPKTLTDESQVNNYLLPEFPDASSLEARVICVNCSHFRELNRWIKFSLFGLNSGDYTLPSKPSNEKLPCRIPVESSSIWDQFFSVPRSDRTIAYPKNCPKFVRK